MARMTQIEQTAIEQAKVDGFLSFPAENFSVDFARKWDDWRWVRRWPRIMVVARNGTPSGSHAAICDCAEAVPPTPTPAPDDELRFIEILVPPSKREGFEMLVSNECMALLDIAFKYEFKDYGLQMPLHYSSGPDAFMRAEMPHEQATALASRAAEIVREDRLSGSH